jgi:hypothetical protein
MHIHVPLLSLALTFITPDTIVNRRWGAGPIILAALGKVSILPQLQWPHIQELSLLHFVVLASW